MPDVAPNADRLPYPADCTTPRRRMEYAERAMRLCVDLRNLFGKWSKGPITEKEYNSIPKAIRDKFPTADYRKRLTDANWKKYLNQVDSVLVSKISDGIQDQRLKLYASTQWTPDLGAILNA
jgi:hypothetical protein